VWVGAGGVVWVGEDEGKQTHTITHPPTLNGEICSYLVLLKVETLPLFRHFF
jgi:hypothetical protein